MHGGMRWRIPIVAESGQLLDVAFEIYDCFIPDIEGGGALGPVLSHEGRAQIVLHS